MAALRFKDSHHASLLAAATFAAMLLACLLVSWPALTGPFLFDDFPNLEHLAQLGGKLDWQSIADYARQYGGAPGRPLSMLSFVINDDAWPSSPWGFKYTNLMIHLLVGVLVFGFARSLARLKIDPARARLCALLSMGAWLLHPLQLSTSMLVVQRMTQLSMLFVVAGLWAYVALAARSEKVTRALIAVAALGVGTVLAVLCKETGALAPLLALVVNATLLRERLGEVSRPSRLILRWGVLIPTLAMLAVIASRWESATNFDNREFSMVERLLTESRALLDYLFQIVLPSIRGGGIYHDDFVISRSLLQPWTTLPSVAFVALLVVGALALPKRRPILSFGILWFFSGHLLESTIFPLEVYFEHRNYLPMFGPLFSLAFWVSDAELSLRRPALALAALWISFAAWLTWVQAPIWGDIRKLTAVWAIEHPDSARAVAQRAQYLNSLGLQRDAADLLLAAYQRGVRGGSFPLQALNIACISNDETLAATARPILDQELRSGRYNRALLGTLPRLRSLVQATHCPRILTEEGWIGVTAALLGNPQYDDPGARNYIHVERAYLFRHRRDLDATMREYELAWEADPSPKLAQLIAATLASAGLYAEAEAWADRALANRIQGFQGMLSDDEQLSLRLKQALRNAQGAQGAQDAHGDTGTRNP
jgi:hypothetical protein